MNIVSGIDWAAMLLPQTPLLEIFLRGTLTYLALLVMLRLVLKRESGSLALTDLLVVVLLADAAENAMADDYTSITDGVLLVGTILGWNYALDWLSYHNRTIGRLLRPPKLLLVKGGQMLRGNMEKELITEEELRSEMRSQGVNELEYVREAYLEPDGSISIITSRQRSRGDTKNKPV